MSDGLIEALRDPAIFGVESPVVLIETGISWVLLAGASAYKIKKPVNLGFLDYSTLAQRRQYCHAELRCNQPLAACLYQDVVAITGSPSAPRLGGPGSVLEYAVRMRRFSQRALLSRRAERGYLAVSWLDGLAATLAMFHQQAPAVPLSLPWGTPAHIRHWALDNLTTLRRHLTTPPAQAILTELADWSSAELSRREALFATRQATGMIRQCHGDLHLNNVVLLEDRAVPFDAIEFNPELSAIDVLNEVAFLLMDLDQYGYRGLGFRFLDTYLSTSNSLGGLAVIPFYGVYRALVRAKVAALAVPADGDPQRREASQAQCAEYLAVAHRWANPVAPLLVITHGLSGSGKTTLSGKLLETLEAVRFRADVVRKRLHGLAPETRSQAAPDSGIYTAEANQRTYQRLAELAGEALGAGLPVILDGTFLQRAERDALRQLARRLGVAMIILHCAAPEAVLRLRVQTRQLGGKDASEADETILQYQLQRLEPLAPEELAYTVRVDTHDSGSLLTLSRRLRRRARVPD